MGKERDRIGQFLAPTGSSQPPMNYGQALLTQKGGWTLGEFSQPTEKEGGDFAKADFEEALDKDSRPVRTAD